MSRSSKAFSSSWAWSLIPSFEKEKRTKPASLGMNPRRSSFRKWPKTQSSFNDRSPFARKMHVSPGLLKRFWIGSKANSNKVGNFFHEALYLLKKAGR